MPERVTRADRYRQVKALRDEGLLLREIAERTGLAVQTVHEYLSDPDGSKANARKRAYDARPEQRAVCVDCQAMLGPRSRGRTERCWSCEVARRGAEHEEVLAFVEWMWNEGRPIREIAEELGWTSGNVGPYLDRLRKAGRIGYRYKAYEGRAA